MIKTIDIDVTIGNQSHQLEINVLTGEDIGKLFDRISIAVAREFDPDANALHIAMNDAIQDQRQVTR